MIDVISWAIFLALSAIAVIMAASMLVTMSMYRAGLALMTSFVALAGLFILLDADLLAAIQVMMNVGGMLVMVLFMVMMMRDPGGEMMWDMKRSMRLPGPGAFSMTMPRKPPQEETLSHQQEQPSGTTAYTCPMHSEIEQDHPGTCPKCGMDLVPSQKVASDTPQADDHRQSHGDHAQAPMEMVGMEMSHSEPMGMSGMNAGQHYEMMVGMAMSTAQLPWALLLGALSALLLIVLVVITPWPQSHLLPTQDATTMVGELLLSRYMIAFEGAAFLILAGIAGAVLLGKREQFQEISQKRQPTVEIPDRQEGERYTCPMHPEIQQDHSGICPTCGMNLVLQESDKVSSRHEASGGHS